MQPPTATTIRLLNKELYANLSTVESKLGGGSHGHLGMLMPEEEYIKKSRGAATYVAPEKADLPQYTGTAATIANQKEEYKDALDAYNEHRQFQAYIQKLMIKAIPKMYIETLEDSIMGYANVTPLDIFTHLTTAYGKVSTEDLEENLKRLNTPWNLDTQIEAVFNNGNHCRQVANKGKDPISNAAYIRSLLTIFRESGVMETSLETWERKKRRNKQ
jgi:hypothetical protein